MKSGIRHSAGMRLITGGEILQLWQAPAATPTDDNNTEKGGIEFFIDGGEQSPTPEPEAQEPMPWLCSWQCCPATPVSHVLFSPDGLLFATVGKVSPTVR